MTLFGRDMQTPVTFFTIVRPFVGEFVKIQSTAILSWLAAVPGSQVLVMGDREGVEDECERLGVTYILGIATNNWGTELVSSSFELAERHARSDMLCNVNSDIVMGSGIVLALSSLADHARPFVIGQRWDVSLGHLDKRKLHHHRGADYFLYRKGTLDEIPLFAVGRTAYDNWLIWAALKKWNMVVIDATQTITALHLNHSRPEMKKGKVLWGQERAQNLRLANECERWYGIKDAPFVMRAGNISPRKHA